MSLLETWLTLFNLARNILDNTNLIKKKSFYSKKSQTKISGTSIEYSFLFLFLQREPKRE